MGEAAPAATAPRVRVWRGIAVLLLLALVAAIAAAVVGGLAALDTRADLVVARREASAAREALGRGELRAATAAFEDGRNASQRAVDRMERTDARLARLVPVVGSNLDAVHAVARAGVGVAGAGDTVTTGLADLPGGLAVLAPRQGRLPIEGLQAMAAPLAEADAAVQQAHRTVAAADTGGPLAPPLRDAVTELETTLAEVAPGVQAAAALAAELPAFLGADERRRYFFGASNPAELRGTGGLIGAYAILTVDDGQLSFSGFEAASDLPTVDPSQIEAPNADYAARYDRDGGAGFARNTNLTPDFPSAAVALERLYAEVEGVELDGAIVADPYALQALLRASGPASVPGVGTVGANAVVDFVTNTAYREFDDSDTRKSVLGLVAAAALQGFLETGTGGDPLGTARGLAAAVEDGHLLLHATEPSVQAAFETAGVAGAMAEADPGYLAVVVNNAGGNKVDYYARRSVAYDVALRPDGGADTTLAVDIDNDAPRRGAPRYVIGPFGRDGKFEAGEQVSLVNVFGARGAELEEFTGDGSQPRVESELGHPVWVTSTRIPSGERARLRFDATLPDAWAPVPGAGTYRLVLQGQTTIRPTRLDLAVRPPAGMTVTRASGGAEIVDGVVRYRGEFPDELVVEVAVAEPGLRRLWAQVREFLGRPLF